MTLRDKIEVATGAAALLYGAACTVWAVSAISHGAWDLLWDWSHAE